MLFILLQVILFIYFIDLGSETRFESLTPNMVDRPVFGAYGVIFPDSINQNLKNFDRIWSIFKNLEDFLKMQL